MKLLWWGIGLAVVVGVGAVVEIVKGKITAPPKGSGPGGEDMTPHPISKGTGASLVWMTVPQTGTVFAVKDGQTYRGTAQIDSSGVGAPSITKDRVSAYVTAHGFTKVTVYAPGDTLPQDWPDKRNAQDVWYVEATRVGDGTVVASDGVNLGLVSVEGQVLSLYVGQMVSTTAPTSIVTEAQSTQKIAMHPGDVLRIVLSGPASGAAWTFEEMGHVATLIAQGTDPGTGELVTDLRLTAGQAAIAAAMKDKTSGAVLDTFTVGIDVA